MKNVKELKTKEKNKHRRKIARKPRPIWRKSINFRSSTESVDKENMKSLHVKNVFSIMMILLL